MKHLIRVAFTALGVSGAALSIAQVSKGSYMKAHTFGRVEYAYPAFLDNPTITTSTLGDGRKEVKFQFSESFVPGSNHISLELYFDAVAGGSKFDHAVVAALGAYTYKSVPAITTGSAGVIKVADFSGRRRVDGLSTGNTGVKVADFIKVGAAEVRVDGTAVYLRYAPSLVNNAPCTAILFRYVPSTVSFTDLADDLNSVIPKRYYLDSAFKNGMNKAIRVPSPKLDQIPPKPTRGNEDRAVLRWPARR